MIPLRAPQPNALPARAARSDLGARASVAAMTRTTLNRFVAICAMGTVALVGLSSCTKKESKTEEPEASEQEPMVQNVADEAVEEEPSPAAAAYQFPEMQFPEGDSRDARRAIIGGWLFFDPRLSVDGTRSCYSCHQNEHGNGGGTPLAVGARKKKLTRHSPVIWNVGYLNRFYWDGRADSLEAQAKGAWAGGNMGVGEENLDQKAKELLGIKAYREAFAMAFPQELITPDTIAKALASYERTLICNDTAFDQFAKGDDAALTETQKEGWEIFMGKAQCGACHAPPFFSSAMGAPEGVYYNVGIGTAGVPEAKVDIGRAAVTKQDADWAAFKVPSLRNVSKSAPYFHDGSVATLEAAVKLMASGGIDNKNKTPLLADRGLSKNEIAAVVDFLGALDCSRVLDKPKMPE